MRVMLLVGRAYPEKLIADVGRMVSDVRDAGLLRMTGGAVPPFATASELPLLGSSRMAEPQKTKAHGCSP